MASGSAPAAARTVRPERSERAQPRHTYRPYDVRHSLLARLCAVFGRLEAFLPAMAAANDALAREDPKSHDIEELTDPTGEHIEMVRPSLLSLATFHTSTEPGVRHARSSEGEP